MVNRRFFEGLMADKRLSLRALAKQIGMSHSQLSLTFSGERRLQLDEAAKLAQALGVSLQAVAQACGAFNGSHAPTRRCAVVGEVLGTGVVKMYTPDVIERVSAPEGLPGDVVAVQVRAADSPLAWADGWLLYFQQPRGIAPDAMSRFCLVESTDGERLVATVRRGYREGSFNLSGPNGAARTNVGLKSATPILMTVH